jgi:hypothetical protein
MYSLHLNSVKTLFLLPNSGKKTIRMVDMWPQAQVFKPSAAL